jgi:FkbM family methyltransferase
MIRRIARYLFRRGALSRRQPSHNEVVTALYRRLLLREPDSAGLQDKVDRLDAGAVDIAGVIDEALSSPEFARGLPAFISRNVAHDAVRFTNDVSQHGEVFEILRLMLNQAEADRWVVDVGARGLERSNSYDLMRHFGWRGLLVEANPRLIAAIERDFAGLDVRVVNCAVADREGSGLLTLGINDDVSSLNSQAAAGWGPTRGEVEVEMRRLASILKEHGVPEVFSLLSLDIEGEDVAVLNDLIDNSPFRPRWVIIEASFDFAIRSLEDGPFSPAVRAAYELRWQNAANLILGRRA